MKSLRAFFGNWVGAIIALAVTIILVTLLFVTIYPNYIAKKTVVTYQSQQECEAATGKPCLYSICDYKCDVYFSGWMPTKN